MECKFSKVSSNPQEVACNTSAAVGHVYREMEGLFTVSEIRQQMCKNDDCRGQEQCPAYSDLCLNGRASIWAK